MKPTDYTLKEQLRLTDREIRHRQDLLYISKEDIDSLVAMKPVISEHVDTIVETFYENQVKVDEISRLIGDSDTLSRLKAHMRKYILDLFDGDYGADYVQSRLRIGLVHKRIGVTPKLYISAVKNLMTLLSGYLTELGDCRLCNIRNGALDKLILFDLELVFDTYIHSLMDELERGKEELERYAESLEETVAERTRELSVLARRDGLTSLLNQRSFYEELKRELSRGQRTGESVSLVYFDLDGFKLINDRQGHRKGDELLVKTARVINTVIRGEDMAFRYGGDEFCIILPHTSGDNAKSFAARLAEEGQQVLDSTGVSFSIGIATATRDMVLDADALVGRADSAMYQAKKTAGFSIQAASAGSSLKNKSDRNA